MIKIILKISVSKKIIYFKIEHSLYYTIYLCNYNFTCPKSSVNNCLLNSLNILTEIRNKYLISNCYNAYKTKELFQIYKLF